MLRYEENNWNILVMAIMINAVQKQPKSFQRLKASRECDVKNCRGCKCQNLISFVDYCVTKYQDDRDNDGGMVYSMFLAHIASKLDKDGIKLSCRQSILGQLREYLHHLETTNQVEIMNELKHLVIDLSKTL